MYDEKLIEDSLAFAEEIKAMLEGKKEAGQAVPQPTQPQSVRPSVSQPAQPQAVRQSVQQTVQPQISHPQVSQQVTKPQTAQAQPQPVVRQAAPQHPVQQRAVQSQTASQSVQQRAVQPQTASQHPVQQRTVQPQAASQSVQQQAVQPQTVPQQPVRQQAVQPQTASQHPVQQRTVQPQAASQQPVQPQAVPQQPVLQQAVQPQAAPQQPVRQQAVQPQAAPQQAVQAQPVQQRTAQLQTASQQPVRQAMPQAAPQQPVQQQRVQPQAAQPQSVQTVSQPQVTQSQPEEPATDGAENLDNTFEITIKFNPGNFKKKLGSLKAKLAPETRTLEDVNAAMEENRQLQQERQSQEQKSFLENGTEIAGKAADMAVETVKKVPVFLKNRHNDTEVSEDPLEAVDALDAEISPLEGEAVEENLFVSKLEDVKAALPEKANKASHILTNVIILLFCVGIAYFLASFVTNYVAHQTTVEGESMEPTLSDGDSVIIQRLTYYFKDPDRYDVVVFPVHYEDSSSEKTYYIKRVIGLPGETVQIIDGSVYINGAKLTSDKYAVSDIQESGIAEKALVLGENQYFVMGDNRNMSTDSRNSSVGLVNKNDIVGEAWICTWPLKHFGSIKK